jgi:hypothetical protein
MVAADVGDYFTFKAGLSFATQSTHESGRHD